MNRVVVEINVNGAVHRAEVEPRTLLSDALRDHFGLFGTNVGCEHGYCGACTVLMNGESVRSCLTLAATASGANVTTVEGLSNPDGALSELQESFQTHHGLQCGFCTPGVLMTATELLDSGTPVDEKSVREALAGNICRCTGYVHIVEAILATASRDQR